MSIFEAGMLLSFGAAAFFIFLCTVFLVGGFIFA